MRTDPVIPKAVIVRVHSTSGDKYLLFRWDLDPTKRRLMCVVDSLERADKLLLYDTQRPEGYWSGPANGVTGYPSPIPAGEQLHDRDRQLGREKERGH